MTAISPAQWLLAEFDATGIEDLAVYDEDVDELVLPEGVQPIFVLKSVMDAGYPMNVGQTDYSDPMRWWL